MRVNFRTWRNSRNHGRVVGTLLFWRPPVKIPPKGFKWGGLSTDSSWRNYEKVSQTWRLWGQCLHRGFYICTDWKKISGVSYHEKSRNIALFLFTSFYLLRLVDTIQFRWLTILNGNWHNTKATKWITVSGANHSHAMKEWPHYPFLSMSKE